MSEEESRIQSSFRFSIWSCTQCEYSNLYCVHSSKLWVSFLFFIDKWICDIVFSMLCHTVHLSLALMKNVFKSVEGNEPTLESGIPGVPGYYFLKIFPASPALFRTPGY